MANYDIIGNIAVVKFGRNLKLKQKKEFAEKLMKENKKVTTVLEKIGKFQGRLRVQKTKFIFGVNTREAIYKENGCEFRLNIDTCYFSPRLSTERKEIAESVKKGDRILVMFGGVGPFAIVLYKMSKAKEIVSVELGRVCNKYAKVNVKRNKTQNVKIIQGDVRKKVPEISGKFDRIVMARPNLKDSFLDAALKKIKKGGVINYYGFYKSDEGNKLLELIVDESKKLRKKVKIIKIKKAGEIAPYKYRFRVDFKVLN